MSFSSKVQGFYSFRSCLWSVFVFLLLVLSLVSGCAKQSDKQSRGREVTLEFWTLQLLTFSDTLKPMFSEYERLHPGVKIKWVDVPFSEGEKRALTAMMSEHVPDVINLNPDFSAVLASRKAVLNMNEWVPEPIQKTYLPVAWQAVSLGEVAFGVPWYLTSSVTLYNKGLLNKAGYQEPPTNFDTLKRFGPQLKVKTGTYALMPTITESGNFLKELKKIGIEPFDKQGKAVFVEHGAARQLAFWVSLYQQRLIPAESITEGHRAAVDRYQAGTLAMLMTGPNFLNIVKENAPAIFQITDVAPQFPTKSAYKDFSTMDLVVPRKSAHPKEAVDFATFMTNRVNQLALAQKAPVLPSVTEALQDPYFRKETSTDLIERARSISAHQLLTATQAYQIHPGQNEINERINYYVQMALLGKLDAQTAMLKAEKEINDLLKSK